MITGIDPKVDYVFKRLFAVDANRPLLVHLINSVLHLPPGSEVIDLQLHNPFIEKERLDDKLAIVDALATDQLGRRFHVEMQVLATPVFPQRVLFYWASLFRGQMVAGTEYHLLQPTVSICLVNRTLFPQTPAHHLQFKLFDSVHSLTFSEHMEIHLIELPKFTASAERITDHMDAWCYFFRHAQALDNEHLPVQLQNVPPIQRAMEVLTVISQNDIERAIYEDRLKKLRDDEMILHEAQYARTEGREEGRKEGRKEGREEGRKEGLIAQIQFCQKLYGEPVASDEELRSQTLEQLEALASQWQQRVLNSPRKS
jgi:predicted transposase/invertase (TIGR01784 family)